jgi:rubrerythrin
MPEQHALRTPNEILHAALEKEMQARDFYAELAVHIKVDFVKELLLKLQNEETKHVHLIESMLGRLAAGRDVT